MKHRVLCFLCFVVYLLAVCTLLSLKIEEEMRVQVEVRQVKSIPGLKEPVYLPASALFDTQLYEIAEGSGWESGRRVLEIKNYTLNRETDELRVSGDRNYCFVLTASRKPTPGELVEIIDKTDIPLSKDRLLAVYPDGVPEWVQVSDAVNACRSENAIIFEANTENGFFFEHKEKENHTALEAQNWRLYSMNTVESFWKQVPFAALIAGSAGYILLLWLGAFLIGFHADTSGRLCIFTGILSIASLILIGVVLLHIDFPAAMLPDANILRFSHYIEDLSAIKEGLCGISPYQESFENLLRTVSGLSVGLLLGHFLLAILTALGEFFYIRRLAKK